jgi:ferrochelatase
MSYGTPASPSEVEAFYTRIRHGRAPSPEQLADLVRRYQAIGGTSPLAQRTADQVAGITQHLEARSPGAYVVRSGTKYAEPSIEDAARDLADARVERVIGLVLAPHESSMSTGQYIERAQQALGEHLAFDCIGAWFDQPDFVTLVSERVHAALQRVPTERRSRALVIFSAHSLPARILATGDDYPAQLAESARLVADAAAVSNWSVAWQSAGRTEDEWLGPDILSVLRASKAEGVEDVVLCPIGFVSDHLEVLYDIDVEAAAVCEGIELNLYRTPSINADERFTAMLARLVESH